MRRLFAALAIGVVGAIGACGGSGDQSTFNPGGEAEGGVTPPSPGPFGDPTDGGKVDPPPNDGAIDCDANPGLCAPPGVCGDNTPGLGESCDDGNTANGDGCSSSCQIEAPYWACGFGVKCVDVRDCNQLVEAGLADGGDGGCTPPPKVPACGDGVIDPGEACDDKNVAGNDGCSADCKAIEANFVCPIAGQLCVSTMVCGDSKITGTETCDDGNTSPLDGCGASCQLEAGWTCLIPGITCTAKQCGDGLLAGSEECDDANVANDDGCSATCKLQSKTEIIAPTSTQQPKTIVHHFKCLYPAPIPNPPKQVCIETTCGDGIKEGTEQCDDGNTKPYDGCSPNCEIEPSCPNGACVAKCGDGLLFDFDGDNNGTPDEECDDGNLKAGDGCSPTCKVEQGYKCDPVTDDFPTYLDLPVVLRDFKKYAAADNMSHPDYETYGCAASTPGIVQSTLTNGVPTYRWNGVGNDPVSGTDTNGSCGRQLTDNSAAGADFTDWYRDIILAPRVAPRSQRIDGTMVRLTRNGALGNYSYIFDSDTDPPYNSLGGFYPLDAKGWGNEGNTHNYAFSTELRYWFTYDSATSPVLDFSGDDDVWVFINNRLALDLGGLHPRLTASFTLNAAKAASLALVDKHLYEVVLFHAERHTNASNFKLTLRGFVRKHSVCTNVCGDGFKTPEEQCDKGAMNSDPPVPYGGCSKQCTLGPYCGDNLVTNPPEQCDDGVNLTPYTPSSTSNACAPGCIKPAFCGDNIVQSGNGEQCDKGAQNTDDPNTYNACRLTCVLGPRCGDGTAQPQFGEECDNGFNLASYVKHPGPTDCAPGCKKPRSCGNGVLDFPFEQCDNGAAGNTSSGAYNSCTLECTLGPRCGDGVLQAAAGEQCDDGNRTNGDGCSAACLSEGTVPK